MTKKEYCLYMAEKQFNKHFLDYSDRRVWDWLLHWAAWEDL